MPEGGGARPALHWKEGVRGRDHFRFVAAVEGALPFHRRDQAHRHSDRVAHPSGPGEGPSPRDGGPAGRPLGRHPPLAEETPSAVAPVGGRAPPQPPTAAPRPAADRGGEAPDRGGTPALSARGHEALESPGQARDPDPSPEGLPLRQESAVVGSQPPQAAAAGALPLRTGALWVTAPHRLPPNLGEPPSRHPLRGRREPNGAEWRGVPRGEQRARDRGARGGPRRGGELGPHDSGGEHRPGNGVLRLEEVRPPGPFPRTVPAVPDGARHPARRQSGPESSDEREAGTPVVRVPTGTGGGSPR